MTKAETVELFHAPVEVVKADANSLMDVISRAASDPAIDVAKLERLMGMYERIQAREAEKEFNAGMVAAQRTMRAIATDASNPQTKSKYASYNALDKVLRPIYTNSGFSLSFDTGEAAENYVRVLCYVSHSGGHSRTYHVDMPADGKGAKGGDVMTKTHAAGAAMSYGSRYLLKLIFNVAVGEQDDDGNGADGNMLVSADQIETINELIIRSGADIEKLCKYFKVGALCDLTRKDYPRVIEALNLKERKKT